MQIEVAGVFEFNEFRQAQVFGSRHAPSSGMDKFTKWVFRLGFGFYCLFMLVMATKKNVNWVELVVGAVFFGWIFLPDRLDQWFWHFIHLPRQFRTNLENRQVVYVFDDLGFSISIGCESAVWAWEDVIAWKEHKGWLFFYGQGPHETGTFTRWFVFQWKDTTTEPSVIFQFAPVRFFTEADLQELKTFLAEHTFPVAPAFGPIIANRLLTAKDGIQRADNAVRPSTPEIKKQDESA